MENLQTLIFSPISINNHSYHKVYQWYYQWQQNQHCRLNLIVDIGCLFVERIDRRMESLCWINSIHILFEISLNCKRWIFSSFSICDTSLISVGYTIRVIINEKPDKVAAKFEHNRIFDHIITAIITLFNWFHNFSTIISSRVICVSLILFRVSCKKLIFV